MSRDLEPPVGSILYLTEVPPDGGGDTLFASMYRAYMPWWTISCTAATSIA